MVYSRNDWVRKEKIDELQSELDSIQSKINELQNSGRVSDPVSTTDAVSEPEPEMESESEVKEETVKVDKTWVDDKNKKFRDGDGGRVSLSFNRMMTLLDSNIKKGDTTKEWSSIKEKLVDANSLDEVQDVIDKYKMSFASNYIAGTRRRKRHGKKRTHRRR
jgi:hypothetical protein